ncbi:acetylglutamate kinase [Blattabacterium cuenoti]|uniref:acetylglutamate kinase n=1 Tax=Blattabacterium cuenoti TaxID=1653831 RepID=UPI00163C0922|nr:acetylglutamate kinase [Blattabacterium cuenoti]
MKINVIKIGGNLISNKKILNNSLNFFCQLKGYKILIHGGGNKADSVLQTMQIPKKIIQGRRITDKDTLDVVIMTYAGLINKSIVSLLQYYQCNAIGLCGADGLCIKSSIRKKNNSIIDYGYVGDIKKSEYINTNFLKFLLKNNITPVLCSITYDVEKGLLNTNADTIASNVAIALSKQKCNITLHFCFDKKGVLKDITDPCSYINKIDFNLFKIMKKNHTICNGMIPKLENAFFALKNGVYKVYIGSPNHLNNPDGSKKTRLCL